MTLYINFHLRTLVLHARAFEPAHEDDKLKGEEEGVVKIQLSWKINTN
jgi:hypothetical protein